MQRKATKTTRGANADEKHMITQEKLKKLLRYDPETGKFSWASKAANCINIGQVAGSIDTSGHVQIKVKGKPFLAHRLAWLYMTGDWPKDCIDHKNRDSSDNRFDNLREASRSNNGANRPMLANNTSGYKGVSMNTPNGKWKAQITVNKNKKHLGLYDCPKEAHAAYCAAAKKYHKQFWCEG